MSYLWMEPQDFRTIELDRESRVPDEPYPRWSEEQAARSPSPGSHGAAASAPAGTSSSAAAPHSTASCVEGVPPDAPRALPSPVSEDGAPIALAPTPSTEDARRGHHGIWATRPHPFDQAAAIEEAWRYADPDELADSDYLARYGEPRGAGADPFGRPDPRTHPEYWSE